MPRGRACAPAGIAAPHWVQKAAIGVGWWQVGQRIWPGLGVGIWPHIVHGRWLLANRRADRMSRPVTAEVSRVPGSPFPYRRVNVVGTSSSGKTTFARMLATRLGVPHVELDALHWEPGWTEAAPEVMRRRTAEAIAADAWVVDGNYAVVRDLVWARAEAVVWLDFPLRTVLSRYAKRTARRIRSQEELWPGTGNRERLSTSVLGRDSLLWWIISTYRRRRREYPQRLAANPHLAAVRLRSPAEAGAWLAALQHEPKP
jgi:adenylate kinase family enzyme